MPAYSQSAPVKLKVASGKCLDVHAPDMATDGARVQIWNCSGATNQSWSFDSAGRLVNGGGKCLDVHAPEQGLDGGRVQVWGCTDGANQKWALNMEGQLRLNGGDKCLDVHAPDMGANGGKVQIWQCSGAPNQNWAVDSLIVQDGSNAASIRAYLDGLPRLPMVQASAGTLGPVPRLPEGVSGQQRTGGRFVNQEAELAILKSFPDVVWPGALVQGATIAGNEFAPIFLNRPPGRVRIVAEFVGMSPVSKYRDLPVFRAAEVDDARTAMLRDINATDATGVQMMELTSAGTIREAMVKLGIAYKSGTNSASLDASVNSTITDNTIFGKYTQTFYSAAFEPDSNSASPFFAANVALDDVKVFASPLNPPLYVSEVKYGRILLIQYTANMSKLDMEAAIKASFNNINGSIDANSKEKLNRMSVTVLAVGSTGELGAATLAQLTGLQEVQAALKDYILRGAKYSPANPGVPIAFTMRYLGSRGQGGGPYSLAIAQMVTDESPELVSLGSTEVCRTSQVWRGQPGGGWRDTGLMVGPKDKVRFSATGSTKNLRVIGPNIVGPDGWLQDIPGALDYAFPLGNRPPHALIGRFGSRNNAGKDATGGATTFNASSGSGTSDSFFVGSSTEITAAEPNGYPNVGRVYLGINDSEAALLGDPAYKLNVDVCITRSIYAF